MPCMLIQKHYSMRRTMPFFDILLRNRSNGSRSNLWTESLNCGTRSWSDLIFNEASFQRVALLHAQSDSIHHTEILDWIPFEN
jgi:hypothetical protein